MVPTPEGRQGVSAGGAGAGTARSRNETPPPSAARGKASSKAKAGLGSTPPASSAAASSGAHRAEEPKAASPPWGDEIDKSLQSVEPPAWCVVVSGLVVGAAVLAVLFPGQQTLEFWAGIRDPLQKLLVERADLLIAFGAMTTFAPLVALGLVTLCRALSDLQYLNFWQTAVVGVTCSIAWGTLVLTQGPTRDFIIELPKNLIAFWDTWSDPIEKAMVDHSSALVAGAALITLSPLALLVIVVIIRAIWNFRVKIVIDETKEEKKE